MDKESFPLLTNFNNNSSLIVYNIIIDRSAYKGGITKKKASINVGAFFVDRDGIEPQAHGFSDRPGT